MKVQGIGLRAFLIVVACVVNAHTLRAATAVEITDLGFFAVQRPGSVSFGWEFTTTVPLEITAWGLYDHGQGSPGPDGFELPHTISLWTSTGTLLTSAVMPAGTTASLTGYFRFVSSVGYSLAPGTYVIGSETDSGDRDWVPSAVREAVFDPAISYVGGRYNDAGGFPSTALGGPLDPPRYFGPNFQFEVVPEPSTVSLIALTLLISACFLHKRKA